ncbi:penicillin-binding protein 1A [Aliikangiella coralliicola]|uniref:Penicillin-binding protein 1A n=1 Tax=Aliikangiella coralliicola TaxID=2592383 RepID=A0A545UHK5_9GAMM|nr:penicillin-binding protein 1A [Aliikangiella coralliicola]TQV88945.1 penicillin-binding protein 1A [Aliikangiella coralliicola]
MKRLSNLAPKFAYIATLIVLMASMCFIGLYLAVGPGLPEVESIRKIRLQTPMRVYSSDHQLIAEFGEKRRIPITLDQVPRDFINALLSTEDQRFYEHSGVDLYGVLRAIVNLALTGSKSQGGSTITMQVARNYYLSRERRFSRKFTEMFLAWKIESELSKNEILELYLNKIHFGHRAYGLGAAAQVYYGSTLDQLTLPQLATLAGIPKGESKYNPVSNPDHALTRRSHVLRRMLTENHITKERFDNAMNAPIAAVKHGARVTVDAPYLAEMVRRYAVERFGQEVAYSDGLKVYTSLDAELQAHAQQALVDGLEEYDQRHGYRGPEHTFELTEQTPPEEMLQWLEDVPKVGSLEPALVLEVDEESAAILLKNNEVAKLTLADVKWARAYVDENHLGKRVKTVDQVLNKGELIRVRWVPEQAPKKEETPAEDTPTNITTTKRYRLSQIPDVSGGFVSLNPDNGAIEVLVGGYDYGLSKFNMVTQARRQPGSNIKPFVYSAAFEKRFTPASMINDMPIVEADITAENFWRPKNDSDNYRGPTSLRVGLRHSKNTVSVRLIREIGAVFAKKYLTQLGFPAEHMPPYLSLALGSASFTPLEVATGYATLANGGYKVDSWFIKRVEDANGQIIFDHQPIQVCQTCETIIAQQNAQAQEIAEQTMQQEANDRTNIASSNAALPDGSAESERTTPEVDVNEKPGESFSNLPVLPVPEEFIAPRVIEARNHFLINDILKDVIHRGTAMPTLTRTKSPLLKRNDLAGKTGTTNDAKDAWFSGYNTRHVATAWVGFKDHSKKLGVREFGGKAALPVWQKFMEKALHGISETNHSRPEGIVTVRIDPKTGLLASNLTENPVFEMFRAENAPTEYADKPIENIFNQEENKVEDESIF